jgi:choline kinase
MTALSRKLASGGGSITEAVILMAGAGSRLRNNGGTLPKPLLRVCGRPLFSYTIDCLKKAGIKIVHVVTGYDRDALLAGLEPLIPAGMQLDPIHNSDWRKQNGISVLAVAEHVVPPFLLTMGDHVFEPAIVYLLLRQAELERLNLAIDKKLDSIFDLNDAMKVRMRGDRLVAIGKDLQDYDAIDTGFFVCPRKFFDYLEKAKRNDDCSLADGVRLMAMDEKVRAVDIGSARWQDVDTAEMLEHATTTIRARM